MHEEMDEQRRREYWASLALRHCPHLGVRTQVRLLSAFGNAYKAFEEQKHWRDLGISDRIVSEMRKESWRAPANDEWTKMRKLEPLTIVLWSDEHYPRLMRAMPDAPILFYSRGDISLCHSPCIACVGSRNASAHGLEVAAYMSRALAACGISVVSGMASGIDAQVHKYALKEIGSSIGVLGTGIDMVYPSSNRSLFGEMAARGLLISEFSPGTPPYANNFPIRNRIISGLSLAVVVIEAAKKSGSLITAKCALDQNREVYAIPGAALDSHCGGCQDLIRQGAKAVFNVEDILNDLSELLKSYNVSRPPEEFVLIPEDPKAEAKALSVNSGQFGNEKKTEGGNSKQAIGSTENHVRETIPCIEGLLSQDCSAKILNLLAEKGSLQIDSISDNLQICIEEINSALLALEMLGEIRRLPGARYEKNHG